MEDTLITLLSTFGYPVIRQGSLAPDAPYPPTFFTFWNNSEDGETYYDNATASVLYDFNVYVYSDNPNTVYNLLDEARELLKNNGWLLTRRGFDIASDEITHTGRGMELQKLDYRPIN